MQSTGPFGPLVHCRARSVTADLENGYGRQFRDYTTMPRLLHTHALATLPAFGNLDEGKAANFWQRCHFLATLPKEWGLAPSLRGACPHSFAVADSYEIFMFIRGSRSRCQERMALPVAGLGLRATAPQGVDGGVLAFAIKRP